MIIDIIENADRYFKNKIWSAAFDFINAQTMDSEERIYAIQGDDLHANIMSYQTKPRTEAMSLEMHRKYIDIQVMITGSELIEYCNVAGLASKTQYDAVKDAAFYMAPSRNIGSSLLLPGTFQVFLPGDGHMAGINPGTESVRIKKIVVKVKADLLF
ncbi:MAG: hypothetical protein A2017_09330 [Lentisphaerae bacterium GWF2_44_16]|nr:MAG: hypothetical protein A2017_09330 [Lentisphaerae bacterium GWF2_44_16]